MEGSGRRTWGILFALLGAVPLGAAGSSTERCGDGGWQQEACLLHGLDSAPEQSRGRELRRMK